MTANIKDIIQNIENIYGSNNSLNLLKDFERVIDELDIYSFLNWKKGELVEGPVYEKYFVTCKFMWPYRQMPDPRGGERLLNYGCEISYSKDVLEEPIKVKSPDDFKPGTKVAKMVQRPIWLVTITMPKKLMQEIHQGSIELESETLDAEDIEMAYEEGMDDDVYKTDDAQQEQTQNAEQQPQQPAI